MKLRKGSHDATGLKFGIVLDVTSSFEGRELFLWYEPCQPFMH